MNKKILVASMALLMGLLVLSPVVSSNSEAALEDNVEFKSYYENTQITSITIDSGEIKSIEVVAWNTTYKTGADEVLRVKLDSVELSTDGKTEMSYSVVSEMTAVLVPDKTEVDNSYEFVVNVNVSKYSSAGTGTLVFNFVIMEGPENSTATASTAYSINLTVNAGSAPGGAYNKLLTIWDMPEWTSMITALVSLLIFLVISIAVAIVAYPRIVLAVGKNRDEKIVHSFLGSSKFAILGLFLTYAISETIFINGGSLLIQNLAYNIAMALYIGFGALLLWSVYDLSLRVYLSRKKIDDDSLAPLFIALGKIAIAMGAFGWALTELGADWTYIITGMGIIGIVLGYGAQSTLTQFFSGLSILCTRPFKPGDLIRLDGSMDTLKVLDVGFMISKFENWANAEVFTMPNDKVISSTIINVTKGTRAYRVFIFVGIAYGSDVKLAKSLMLEAANEHPHVIKDGSFEVPAARLNEFADSALTMRLAAYVDDFESSYIYAGELREMINDKFKANGITIAFPQMDVHVINDGASVEDDIITDKTIADKE